MELTVTANHTVSFIEGLWPELSLFYTSLSKIMIMLALFCLMLFLISPRAFRWFLTRYGISSINTPWVSAKLLPTTIAGLPIQPDAELKIYFFHCKELPCGYTRLPYYGWVELTGEKERQILAQIRDLILSYQRYLQVYADSVQQRYDLTRASPDEIGFMLCKYDTSEAALRIPATFYQTLKTSCSSLKNKKQSSYDNKLKFLEEVIYEIRKRTLELMLNKSNPIITDHSK